MVILGWQLQSPIKVVYARGRGFGWTWRGWPLRRVRWFGYAPLAGGVDLSDGYDGPDPYHGLGPEIVYGPGARSDR